MRWHSPVFAITGNCHAFLDAGGTLVGMIGSKGGGVV